MISIEKKAVLNKRTLSFLSLSMFAVNFTIPLSTPKVAIFFADVIVFLKFPNKANADGPKTTEIIFTDNKPANILAKTAKEFKLIIFKNVLDVILDNFN